ncbi:ATP-dependent nuclease [Mycolicibacterium wolinskyi]|uniref:ATP-dependent nuclease n=1 Tax=Mycolicibacterium wolinskyi TaxID=59750 RepID=UPI0039177476
MEHIRTLTIEGLRGYQDAQTVDLAIPDGTAGSGLTVVVGANNSGKSTVIEALTALAVRNATSYSEGKRNALSNSAVRIRADFVSGKTAEIRTVQSGGSQTEWSSQEVEDRDIGIIQSRRGFDPYFGTMSPLTRRDYNRDYQGQAQYRPQSLDPSFTGRLFALVRDAHGDRHIFDELLGRVMGGESLAWTIDQSDNGRYYIKFRLEASGLSHSSEGVGEGINSLFVILSALYDLDATSVVAIDEPELSLHPQYQRRLRQVLADRAAHSQIIYTTHSPYFVDWNDIANGATIVRAHKRDAGGLALRQPSRAVLSDLVSLLRNDNSPHTLSLHASEVFFVEDRVIITEGQEDVVFFPKIDSALGMSMQGSFYGWGAGGASNISKVCRLLRDLGYTKVVAIFDGDKASEADACREEFPDYHVAVLPADDIRSKSASTKAAKKGLWDGGKFDETKRSETVAMYKSVNAYLSEIPAATN